ncbi:MAG: GHKL domain-containing protein [Peptococcaceae bacterium]
MLFGKKIKPAEVLPPALLLLAVIVCVILSAKVSARPHISQGVTNISDRWQYHTDADPAPRPIGLPGGTKGVYLNENWYLTYTLPDIGSNAAILFRSDYLRVIASLDGQEIYRYGYEESAFTTPGKELILIPLPDGYAGREMTLTLTPTMNLRAYGIYMGDEASLLSMAVRDMLPAFVLATAVLLLGLALLAVYFMQKRRNRAVAADFWFGIFVVLVAVFIPSKSFLLLMLLNPISAAFMPMIVSFLLPCAVLLFARASCPRFRLPLMIALAVHITGYLPLSLMQLLSPNPPTELLSVFVFLVPVYYTLVVIAFALEIRGGKKDYRRLTWSGLLIIGMFVIDRVNSFMGNPLHLKDVEQFTKSGLLIFIAVEVIGRVKENYKASAQLLADYQAAQVKNELALEHFENVKEHMQEVYRLNHDIHHHFGALGHLLEQNDIPRAREYLAKLTGDYSLDKQIVYAKNQLLNYIVGYTAKQAEAKGIRFTHTIDLPENAGISDSDLYSLFINIIDNAIAAAASVQDEAERHIELACNMKNGFMHVSCKNSKANGVVFEGGRYVTTKSGDGKHGLGLSIIENIVEKYRGVMDIEYDSNSFTIKLVVKVE